MIELSKGLQANITGEDPAVGTVVWSLGVKNTSDKPVRCVVKIAWKNPDDQPVVDTKTEVTLLPGENTIADACELARDLWTDKLEEEITIMPVD